MNIEELAKKFLDEILYDGDWINRWEPFDEKKHYGDWPKKIEIILNNLIEELGDNFFVDDFVEMFTCGDYDDMMDEIDQHPSLQILYDALNEYHEWLCETIE